jgi:hypothetical protein
VRWSLWLAWRGDLLFVEDALENNGTCLELADQHDGITDEATRASLYGHGEQAITGRFTFNCEPTPSTRQRRHAPITFLSKIVQTTLLGPIDCHNDLSLSSPLGFSLRTVRFHRLFLQSSRDTLRPCHHFTSISSYSSSNSSSYSASSASPSPSQSPMKFST